MKRIFCLLSLCLVFVTNLFAETSDSLSITDNNRPTTSFSFGLGTGSESHHVSYLSPLLYEGIGHELWAERLKRLEKRGKLFYSSSNLSLRSTYLSALNEANLMHVRTIKFDYHYYYDWKLVPNFNFLLGGYAGLEFGSDELEAGISNNEHFPRRDFPMLGFSMRPTLCIQTKRRVIKLADQFDFYLAGFSLTPNYTQPYFESELSGSTLFDFYGFNSFIDKFSFTNRLTADIPLRRTTLRLGMVVDRTKSMIKQIDNRTFNVRALAGFSFDYRPITGRKHTNIKNIFE